MGLIPLTRLYSSSPGEPKKALRLFYRFIEQSQELVVRPNRDLSLCQEAARMCLAAQGSLHFIRQKRTV